MKAAEPAHTSGSGPATTRDGFMRGFDPRRNTATPRHAEIAGRYQNVYTLVEFAAAIAFIVGSVFFFYRNLTLAADWMFLAGSILFAVRPTVAVAQQVHLSRLPLDPIHHRASQPLLTPDLSRQNL